MSTLVSGDQVRSITLGRYATKAGMTITNSSQDIFLVTGGLVLVTSIVGIVTTVLGGAANLNLTHTPTGGSAGDLSAATAVDTDAVGTIYTISGVAADLMSVQAVAGVTVPNVTFGLNLFQAAGGLVLPAGALKQKTSAAQTGAVKWHCTWVPIEAGAALAAA